MTSEGWEEMFEGDFADKCADKSVAHVDWELGGGSSVRRPRSEDHHQHNAVISGHLVL